MPFEVEQVRAVHLWMCCSCRNADAAYDLNVELKPDSPVRNQNRTYDGLHCYGFWFNAKLWRRVYNSVSSLCRKQGEIPAIAFAPEKSEKRLIVIATDVELVVYKKGLLLSIETYDGSRYELRIPQQLVHEMHRELVRFFGDPTSIVDRWKLDDGE